MNNLFKSRQDGAGFSLVELLVALALGALLVIGALQVFDSSRHGSRIQLALASVQDSGRIAMEFITRDIRNADFSGCLRDKSRIVNHLDSNAAGYQSEVHDFYALGGVFGVESASSLTIDGLNVIDGTSTISIVSAQPACNGVTSITSAANNESDPITLRGSCPIEAGTVLLVGNCYFADIFVKTNAVSSAGIEHSTTAVANLLNSSESFQTTYKGDSQILVPYVRQYFVASGSNGNNSLYRRDDGVNREIILNVTGFQVLYGHDSDDDGAADNYSGAFTPAEMLNVVSVRVDLTVVSEDPVGNGELLSRTYSSTTSIRNRVVNSEADPNA